MPRPHASEYAPFYQPYLTKTKGTDLLNVLSEKGKEVSMRLRRIPASKADYAYAEDKWTVKEVVRHVLDTEWIFAYRALRFSRRDQVELPGFDQDLFARQVDLSNVGLSELIMEFEMLRDATVQLFSSFSQSQLEFVGKADGKTMSVRASGFIIAGHAIYHCDVLDERY